MAEAQHPVRTALKLAAASLAVGVVLAAFGVTPGTILDAFSGVGRSLWNALTEMLGWAGPYMLLGALVVLPLWLAHRLWRRFAGRR